MKSSNFRKTIPGICLAALLGLCFAAAPIQEAQDQPAREQQTPRYPIETFRLQNADASQVAGAVMEIIGGRRFAGEALALEGSTNTLLLSLTPERMRIARPLIAELDQAARDSAAAGEVEVFRLQHTAVDDIAGQLMTVFGSLRIAGDTRNNSIVAHGSAPQLAELRALIEELDRPDTDDPQRLQQQLQLRVIWLIDGAEGAGRTPPGDLQPVLDELGRYGISGLSMVGQSFLRTTAGAQFEHSFDAATDRRWQVNLGGVINPAEGETWRTQFFLSASRAFDPELDIPEGRRGNVNVQVQAGTMGRIEHQTTILTRAGRFVVLAMSPTDEKTSIFVLQITETDA